uniref:Uncharacterized protein n=1 Tax=Brassica campestris TaxID=3711 RepID=M4CVA0_BRACM
MTSRDSVQTSGKSGEIYESHDSTVQRVRDVRVGKQHALAFKAQKDVNVISWNRFFCQEWDALVSHFEKHKHPTTSIE